LKENSVLYVVMYKAAISFASDLENFADPRG